jgi:hypothetical protein
MNPDDTHPPQSTAPNMRTFSLKSDEAYEALLPLEERGRWRPNCALPREPRVWGQAVIPGVVWR